MSVAFNKSNRVKVLLTARRSATAERSQDLPPDLRDTAKRVDKAQRHAGRAQNADRDLSSKAVPDPRDELIEHLPALRALAISLTGNTGRADELVQETVEKALRNMDRFRPGTDMWSWLFTILRNTYFSHKRRLRREISDDFGKYAHIFAVKPAHDGRLAMYDFVRACAQLSAEQRQVLILVGALGMRYEEVADICGVAAGTVKSRVNRARNLLLHHMDLKNAPSVVPTDKVTAAVIANRTRFW